MAQCDLDGENGNQRHGCCRRHVLKCDEVLYIQIFVRDESECECIHLERISQSKELPLSFDSTKMPKIEYQTTKKPRANKNVSIFIMCMNSLRLFT